METSPNSSTIKQIIVLANLTNRSSPHGSVSKEFKTVPSTAVHSAFDKTKEQKITIHALCFGCNSMLI